MSSRMSRIFQFFVIFIFFKNTVAHAFPLAGEQLHVVEVLPLFNVRKHSSYVGEDQKGINPEAVSIPKSVILAEVNDKLQVEGFIGDTVFKDILIKTTNKHLDVKLRIHNIDQNEIQIIPRLVSSWYQSGFTTTQKKHGGELTYELLLADDKDFIVDDKWVQSKKGGWVYIPPSIDLNKTISTSLGPDSYKRILLKISLGESLLPGSYSADLIITAHQDSSKKSMSLPLVINVLPVKLTLEDQQNYKILLYTAFKLDRQAGRSKSYVNAMRFYGTEEDQESLLLSYLTDIKEHGFNGITIRDWDALNLEKTLKIASEIGFKYIVLHATTPLGKKHQQNKNPIVSVDVKNIFDKHGVSLYYYGYDEVGGNTALYKQLKLNQDIHAIGGKSVNAVFWDDMANALNVIGNDKSKCFDIIAHSMGSHGHIDMFESLPYKGRDDICSKNGTEYLTYWHPHVENPVVNRIFSGFWLWASGFDGIIPHGYYFPSHIEKALSDNDIKRGESKAASPYDDWSFWLPGAPLRHHNSVYPSKDGPVGTLQWEGVLSGNVDLKYILTLESKLDDNNLDKRYKDNIINLLNEIRSDVLQIESPYMSDRDSIQYLQKLESWKRRISGLLLH